MNKLLITGAAGFIGCNFVRYWREHYPNDLIIILDKLTYAGNKQSISDLLDDRCKLIVEDIVNTDIIYEILKENKLNKIVHFAAESHVDRSISGPDVFVNTNILGTYSLLKAAKRVWIDEGQHNETHHFHHVSTDEVFGSLELHDDAFTELTAYAPNSPYSASKASSDFLVRSYHHTYGLSVTTSNCSNNYGPYHFPEKLIPLTIINILNGNPVPVYGTGKNIRDWLFVDDHSYGIDLILTSGSSGLTYNIGGCNEWTNIDIVELICKSIDNLFSEKTNLVKVFPNCPAALGATCASLVTYVEDRAGHDLRYAIDTTFIANELNYTPKISFESGLEKTIDWYINNRNWWESILDGSYRN